MRRAAGLAVLVVLALLATMVAREAAIGREELAAAEAATAASDWPEAIAHARAAAEALAPGSPWPQRGMLRLSALGHDAEARGDDATALLAYGAMRAAALATRAPGSDSGLWRARAEEGLARVAASRQEPGTPRVAVDAMLASLRETPSPGWGPRALLALGTIAVVAGLARLAMLARAGGGGSGGAAAAGAGARVALAAVVAGAAVCVTSLLWN